MIGIATAVLRQFRYRHYFSAEGRPDLVLVPPHTIISFFFRPTAYTQAYDTCGTSVLVTCVPLHVPPAYVPGNVYDLRGTTRTVLTCLRYSYGGSVVAFRYCTHTVLVPVTCCYASSLRYPCRSYHLRTLQAKTLARSPLRRLTYRVPATRYRVLRPQDPPSVSLTYDFGHWICQIVKDS